MTVDDQERRDQGFGVRRRLLGEDYVDTALARTSTVTAAFQDYLTRTAWGEIWSRPGLESKTRSLLTIALLTALSHDHELALHIRAGVLHNGVTPEEVGEVILHASVYAGVPAANRAMAVAQTCWASWDTRRPRPVRASEGTPTEGSMQVRVRRTGLGREGSAARQQQVNQAMPEGRRGVLSGIAAYTLWGPFPLYWPLLKPASPIEVLAHWCPIPVSVISDGLLMHPRCRQVIALLA